MPPNIQKELLEFLKSLPLYCVVESKKPGFNSFVVVHTTPPSNALVAFKVPTLGKIISDKTYEILSQCLNYRAWEDSTEFISLPDEGVITVIGHVPVEEFRGYSLMENNKLLMIDGGCAFMAYNSDSKVHPMMATLVQIDERPGKTQVALYGDNHSKELRQARIRR